MKKINKYIATLLIFSMIFTSGGMSSFANIELGDVEKAETSFFIDENANIDGASKEKFEISKENDDKEIELEEDEIKKVENETEETEEIEKIETTDKEDEENESEENETEVEKETNEIEEEDKVENETNEIEAEENKESESEIISNEVEESKEESKEEKNEEKENESIESSADEEADKEELNKETEIEETTQESETAESKTEEELIRIATTSDISTSSEIEEELSLEADEKKVDDKILGAGPRSVVFQLPKDLVDEGVITNVSGGNLTASEDGTTYTQDLGWGNGTETRYVSMPSFMTQSQNPGLTFTGEWTSGGKTYRGSAQVTFTNANPTVTFTPKITDNRKKLTLKINQGDWKYASFSEIQDAQYPKKVEYKNAGEITTKFYQSYTPIFNKPDDKYEVKFNGLSMGHIENSQDTTQTAQIVRVNYKVIYTIPNVQDDVSRLHISGFSPDSGKTQYTQEIKDSEGKYILSSLTTDGIDYKRKLDCWVDDVTGEEYQPGQYTHTGIKNVKVTARVRAYEPIRITYVNNNIFSSGEHYPEKGTKIATPSTTNTNNATFKYWYIDDENVPVNFNTHVFNEDTTLTAKVELTQYPITYNKNGGEFVNGYTAPTYHTYFDEVILPTASVIQKEFAEFKGWYQTEDFSGERIYKTPKYSTDPYTLYAKWDEKNYTITYNLNGGSVVSGNTLITNRPYSTGVTLLTGAQIEKIGSGFDGWYENSDFSGNPITVIPEKTDRDIVLYAKWIERDYIISYNYNGGILIDGYTPATQRKYGDIVWLPRETQIKKQGYLFSGWYENPEFSGNAIDVIPSDAIRDYSLHLKWNEGSYGVSVNLKGGSLKDGVSIKQNRRYTEEIILPTKSQIEKTGYTFLGWKLIRNDTLTTISNEATTVPANIDSIVTVEARWQENEYSITYNEDGGTYANGYQKITRRRYTDSVTLPNSSQITKEGYTFGGWYDNASFTGSAITTIPANTVTNKILYVKWTMNNYSITFVENGGTFNTNYTKPTTRRYVDQVILPTEDNIKRKGFTFSGWYDNASFTGSSVVIIAANTAADKTLYAKWTPRVYNIIYHEDGGEYREGYTKIVKRDYDQAVTLPTATDITKDGGTFKGWYTNPSFTGDPITVIPANTDEDVNVYVKWQEAIFKVTYNENGAVYKNGYTKVTERRYSDALILPMAGDMIKKGYIFGGWYENSNFEGSLITNIPAKTSRDVVVYAKWDDGVYTITYYENGGVYVDGYNKITSRNYSSEIILPTKDEISKKGFDFEGWYESPEFRGSMVLKIAAETDTNKFLYAKWKGKEYNVTLNTNGGTIKYGNVKKYTYSIGATLPTSVIGPNKNKKFVGWYENEDFSGDKVEKILTTDIGEKTYYAKYTNVYNVEFNAGEGTGTMNSLVVDEGKKVTIPSCTFVKLGYKFKSWSSSDGKTYEINKSYELTDDVTLTAIWEEIKEDKEEHKEEESQGGGSSGEESQGGGSSGEGSSSGGSSSGGSSSGGSSSGGSSSGGSSSGGSSRGGSTGGGSSSGGSTGGGSGTGPSSGNTSNNGQNAVGPGAIDNTNTDSTNNDVVPNVGSVITSNEVVLKAIENGTAKKGMYFAWEVSNKTWKAKDLVTNEYVKNEFIYVYYAGKTRKYYFNELGEMAVGWINYKGYIYYLSPQEGINYGDMVTGIQYVDGKLCEFLPSGEFYREISVM